MATIQNPLGKYWLLVLLMFSRLLNLLQTLIWIRIISGAQFSGVFIGEDTLTVVFASS